MGYFDLWSTPSALPRGGALLPSLYADTRYIDAVVVSKAASLPSVADADAHAAVVGDYNQLVDDYNSERKLASLVICILSSVLIYGGLYRMK